jgi:hypothetical protein
MPRHFVLVPVLFALGCGAAATPPADAPSASGPDLRGQWESDCVPGSAGQSLSLAFDIGPSDWALDYVTYGDAACSTPFLTVRIDGPYEIGPPSPVVPGAYEARFGFAHKTVTPHGAAAVGFLSSLSGCGSGSWTDGVAGDVLAAGCPGLGQRPLDACPADYDLVSIEGRSLRFGSRPADNDMCTPERRPTELSPLALHRR